MRFWSTFNHGLSSGPRNDEIQAKERLDSLRRILVIATPALGDVLLCTPLIRTLRLSSPSAQLDVLVRKNHGIVLEGNRDVDGVIEANKHPSKREYLELLRRCFRAYDLVISNSISDRAAMYAFFAGRRRISLVPPANGKLPWKRWVYDRYAVLDPAHYHSLRQTNLLAELLGLRIEQPPIPPRAHNSRAVLAALLGPDWEHKKFAVIHPTPSLPYKRWHAPGWRAIAEHLRRHDIEVVVSGGGNAEELDYLQQSIRFPEGTVKNLAGQLRLGDLPTLLERCAVFVGVDTVVTHMAAAIGTPTVALFGPTNPLLWGPWPETYSGGHSPFMKRGSQRVKNVHLLQGPGACVPCSRQGCLNHRYSRSDCLLSLGITETIEAIDQLLSRTLRAPAPAASAV